MKQCRCPEQKNIIKKSFKEDLMPQYIEVRVDTSGVGLIRLNRPEKLNAWTIEMREEIMVTLADFDARDDVRSIVMTGAGNRAFSAGQDLEEAHDFDTERVEAWMRGWERFYDALRSLRKPLVMALNGTAAGSAFQVALLGDIRIGHTGVRMGQPEINSGICSVTGPWIMNAMLGLSRTIELTLTGRLMDADECHRVGLLHEIVPEGEVLGRAMAVASGLAAKPPVAMRLNKQRFREVSEAGFRDAIDAGIRIHVESYLSGEPARMMEEFFQKRGGKVKFA
jgi:enoyl-CoA hydratase